jgi:phosphatidylinositol phospholipase C delta
MARTSKILFVDAIKSIKNHAFVRSCYPVILSLEVHCSVAQQERMAAILHEELGDILVTEFLDSGETELPSPNKLKGRVLIKVSSVIEALSCSI